MDESVVVFDLSFCLNLYLAFNVSFFIGLYRAVKEAVSVVDDMEGRRFV
jgi:hypothetical protein